MNRKSMYQLAVLILFGGAVVCSGAIFETMKGAPAEQVIKVSGIRDLFQTGDIYIGGQPNLETLRWIKSQGVTLVVNTRTEVENREFAANSFTEENIVREMGMTYSSLPIGERDSYAPKTVDKLAELVAANKGKALIHCASGGRVSNLWIAFLVRHRGHSLNEAIAIGKQMKFTFPVEDFLGTKISFSTGNSSK